MGCIPLWTSLWMVFPSVSVPHFICVSAPMGILSPLLRRTKVSIFWSSLFLSFVLSVNFILCFPSFWSYIHFSVSAYHVCCFMIRLRHSGWHFLLPSICLRNSWFHWFYYLSTIPLCNVPQFLYPFFCWGTSGFYNLLAIINKATMKIVEHVSLLHIGASSGNMSRSGIPGTSCNTMSNFLRKCQTECFY